MACTRRAAPNNCNYVGPPSFPEDCTLKTCTIAFCLVLLLACPRRGPGGNAENGIPFDLQAFIDQGLHAGKSKIVVPPGRYRVTPRHQRHLAIAACTTWRS